MFWLICAYAGLGLSLAVLGWRLRTHTLVRGAYHPTIMSVTLLFSWYWSKIVAHYLGWPAAHASYPVIDTLVGLLAAALWIRKVETWKGMLGFVLLAKLSYHATNWHLVELGLRGIPTDDADYVLGVNVFYGLELLCVARSGGEFFVDVAARWVLRHPGSHLGHMLGRHAPP
jgi:hypothetical protein